MGPGMERRMGARRGQGDRRFGEPGERRRGQRRRPLKRQLSLLRYARPHVGSMVGILVTMAISIGLGVARPWPIKILLDQVLGKHPIPHRMQELLSTLPGGGGREGLALYVAIALVVISALAVIVQMISTLISVKFGQKMTFELGADVFLHVQRLSMLFHSRRPVGDTIARVTGDPYSVQELVTGVFLPTLSSLITVVTILVIMVKLNVVMTLVSLSVIPFLVMNIYIFRKAMKDRVRERRDLEGIMMTVVERALNAIPAVQAFNRAEREHALFRERADETVQAYVRATYAQLWFQLAVGLVSAVATAAMLYLGARFALEGKITVGTIVLFVLYLQQLYQPLNSLAFTASTFQSAAAKSDRVLEFLNTVPDVQNAPDAQVMTLKGDVRYEHVYFGYEGDRTALDDVSLEAYAGEVVAIVGPTGAGKTTLVNMLLRFYDPWSGWITIDGTDLRCLDLKSLREQVAVVLQDPFIFPISVADNIAYGRPNATREQIEAAAEAASADDFIRRMPDGYDTIVGERGTTLSGGEKQRLSIARAFLKDAPILILDEPTSALDARTEARLLDALSRLMKGRTTFIIAHRLSTIRNADRILVMEHAKIVEQGSHEELVAAGGLYSMLYRQQMDLAQHVGLDIQVVTSGAAAEE
jgi:ATP-binding cassette subfamily B protein/subfamily B ATP-binding cassette protein MsbA